jgi:hypothetical protein
MNITLVDNIDNYSLEVFVENLSLTSVDFISKKIFINQIITSQISSLVNSNSKIYINNTSLPILPIQTA